MTLNIAIITHKPEGIQRLARSVLPQMDSVSYVVSWQEHENAPVPVQLLRPDIKILRFDGKGLSANRNNSLAHCTADIIMIADDDLEFYPDGIRALISAFEVSDTDVATLRSEPTGTTVYPDTEFDLSQRIPKGYNVKSIEIALRRSTAGHLRCCPELGLGSPRMHGGEDEMLLLTAIKRGLKCRFFPITVCRHDHPSTGSKARFTNSNLRASGCIIALAYPASAILRLPLKAWRISRAGQAGFFRALFRLVQGAVESVGLLRRNRKYLW